MQVDPRRNLASCIRDPWTVLLWVGETKKILNHLIGFPRVSGSGFYR